MSANQVDGKVSAPLHRAAEASTAGKPETPGRCEPCIPSVPMKRLQQWQMTWQALQLEPSEAPRALQPDALQAHGHPKPADDGLARPSRRAVRTAAAAGVEGFACDSRRAQERDELPTWQADALQRPPSAGPTACAPLPLSRGELAALVERHCERVWIQSSAPTPGLAPNLMLDLGRWMPGCRLELARSAGQLRLTLRGLAPHRVHELAAAFEELGAALAQRLGCAVVTAVDSQGERR